MSPLVFLLLLFVAFGLFGLISDRMDRTAKVRRVDVERRVTLKHLVPAHPRGGRSPGP
ncbi:MULTISPECIES: hypothetical protein [Nannocystis]|uniref:Uncharacterized protein n=1 Tax=Nannocystis radixulma TaxID=2995305 RepID=A0ABT5B6R4_9BACT|nr:MULTISPECIES: hypothetical protein [Nannocystis]MCY1060339.1 hypothetical protein [Nannocystis sp. SCPEA4]MDC0669423.1 hypothetical protein [Nannocystis radixulma]